MDKQHHLRVSSEQGELRRYPGTTIFLFQAGRRSLQGKGESQVTLPARINSIAPPGPATVAGTSPQPSLTHTLPTWLPSGSLWSPAHPASTIHHLFRGAKGADRAESEGMPSNLASKSLFWLWSLLLAPSLGWLKMGSMVSGNQPLSVPSCFFLLFQGFDPMHPQTLPWHLCHLICLHSPPGTLRLQGFVSNSVQQH